MCPVQGYGTWGYVFTWIVDKGWDELWGLSRVKSAMHTQLSHQFVWHMDLFIGSWRCQLWLIHGIFIASGTLRCRSDSSGYVRPTLDSQRLTCGIKSFFPISNARYKLSGLRQAQVVSGDRWDNSYATFLFDWLKFIDFRGCVPNCSVVLFMSLLNKLPRPLLLDSLTFLPTLNKTLIGLTLWHLIYHGFAAIPHLTPVQN